MRNTGVGAGLGGPELVERPDVEVCLVRAAAGGLGAALAIVRVMAGSGVRDRTVSASAILVFEPPPQATADRRRIAGTNMRA